MTAPTPEQFMTSPPDPDEEEHETPQTPAAPAPVMPYTKPADSLALIAGVLERIAGALEQPGQVAELRQNLDEIEADLHAQLQGQQEVIDQVLALIKPSTSKLANSIRAALQPPAEPVEPDPEPAATPLEQPAHDADVEEWRDYARARGYRGDGLETANRSQIRTHFGIPQPVAEQDGES